MAAAERCFGLRTTISARCVTARLRPQGLPGDEHEDPLVNAKSTVAQLCRGTRDADEKITSVRECGSGGDEDVGMRFVVWVFDEDGNCH